MFTSSTRLVSSMHGTVTRVLLDHYFFKERTTLLLVIVPYNLDIYQTGIHVLYNLSVLCHQAVELYTFMVLMNNL